MEQTGLRKKLGDDLKQAMKAGDTVRRSVIRMVMSSINNAEIAKQAALEEGDILGVIARDIKQHHESIDSFKQGKRPDLVAREEAELAILQSYLPQQLTRDEIINEVRQVVAAVGAQGPGDKGRVMQQLMPRMKGRADGKVINEIVTELLGK
ncbi:MAG TPA: GatB/YqeY domain-containing protein [Dehalococcoidales bacterium]|nr:MAG: glutamyl-tRNA amidotransferase [Chloroflexi bacterium RBG_16_60_22]HJX12750.1 GatB/YqeY domain-containing protein [Dehalococcoidales bacterium]